MNTLQHFKSKLQTYTDPAFEFGMGFLKDMRNCVIAERKARIKLMTDGWPERENGSLTVSRNASREISRPT